VFARGLRDGGQVEQRTARLGQIARGRGAVVTCLSQRPEERRAAPPPRSALRPRRAGDREAPIERGLSRKGQPARLLPLAPLLLRPRGLFLGRKPRRFFLGKPRGLFLRGKRAGLFLGGLRAASSSAATRAASSSAASARLLLQPATGRLFLRRKARRLFFGQPRRLFLRRNATLPPRKGAACFSQPPPPRRPMASRVKAMASACAAWPTRAAIAPGLAPRQPLERSAAAASRASSAASAASQAARGRGAGLCPRERLKRRSIPVAACVVLCDRLSPARPRQAWRSTKPPKTDPKHRKFL
jgi:hypothetical protein